MNAIVVSDLHIGSRFFFRKDFEDFLKQVPRDSALVLNGDVINNPYEELTSPHQRILDIIEELSLGQEVVWVEGNHDRGCLPDGLGNVEFKALHTLGRRALIVHGHDFDEVMPRNQTFMKGFKMMHDLRVRLGAKPVHVAHYAKKWGIFYDVLRRNVMKNAMRCAMENGYEAVVCGHTHYPEDRVLHGVRYINTGSWTERPVFYLSVTPGEMTLKRFENLS